MQTGSGLSSWQRGFWAKSAAFRHAARMRGCHRASAAQITRAWFACACNYFALQRPGPSNVQPVIHFISINYVSIGARHVSCFGVSTGLPGGRPAVDVVRTRVRRGIRMGARLEREQPAGHRVQAHASGGLGSKDVQGTLGRRTLRRVAAPGIRSHGRPHSSRGIFVGGSRPRPGRARQRSTRVSTSLPPRLASR